MAGRGETRSNFKLIVDMFWIREIHHSAIVYIAFRCLKIWVISYFLIGNVQFRFKLLKSFAKIVNISSHHCHKISLIRAVAAWVR